MNIGSITGFIMVRFVDFFLAFVICIFLGVVIASPAHAAGSISRGDFLEAIDDSGLREFVQQNFRISDVGIASRVGAEDPQNSGKRVSPFEIVARLRYGHERVVLHLEDRLSVLTCMESTYFAPHCLD